MTRSSRPAGHGGGQRRGRPSRAPSARAGGPGRAPQPPRSRFAEAGANDAGGDGTTRGPARAGAVPTPPGKSPDAALVAEVRSAAAPRDRERAGAAFTDAVVALAAGDVTRALPAAREAKELAPRAAVAREVLGIAAYRAGEFRESLAALGAYRRMSGRVDQNHLLADAYRATGQPEKAVPLIREELASDVPPALRAEATAVGAAALADLGRFDEALGLLAAYPSREEAAADHDLRVWYVHADVLERAGRRADSVRLFELVRRHDPGAFDVDDRLAALDERT